MKDIIIFGSGGFAQEVIWTIEDINQNKKDWNILGLMVDYTNTINPSSAGFNNSGVYKICIFEVR